MRRTVWLMVALLVLGLPLVGAAQTQAGRITGAVTDASGAFLPGATVTAKSESGAVKTTVTDAAGRYTITDLAPGIYEVTIELTGFDKQVSKVVVAPGQAVTAETKLQIAKQQETVQVTGTLIPRPTLEAMTPVTTMDVQELSYQGKTRLEDLLTTLPQIFTAQNSTVANGASGTATVNLRNLGSQRTLVLIDGKRMPAGDTQAITADLNFIPAALVKRVDVLTGGASSVYGADAVAGVVNFILDRDFVGLKAGFSPGGYQHNNNDALAQQFNAARGFQYPTGSTWDGGQWDAYAALGGRFADTKGHATVYLDYRKTNALLKSARDYTNCSFSSMGDTSPQCYGSSTAATGRFFTDDGGDYTVQGTSFVDFASKYLFNYAPYNYMQRPDQRWAAGGFMNFDWNPRAHAYAEVMFMDDRTDAQIAPSGDFGTTLYVNCDNPMLSADQRAKVCDAAGYGAGIVGPNGILGDAGLQILRRNVEGGGRVDKLSHQSFRIVGGLKGQLDSRKVWTYDVYLLDAETRVPETYLNDLNTPNLQDALFVVGDRSDPSTWRCRSGNAGCVPLNYFTDKANGKVAANVADGVTQAALNYVSLPLVRIGHTRTELLNGQVAADLRNYGVAFPKAVEGVSFAAGFEVRKESLDDQPDLAYQMGWGSGQGSTILPVTGDYNVKDFFVESAIPFVQEVRGAKNLSLGLGYRYSKYNLTGGHPSWKIEGAYSPATALKIRAGYNKATRSPNIRELFAVRSLALGGSTDPCSGSSPDFSQAQCALQGVPANWYGKIQPNPAGQYNTITGGNTLLNPETAKTTSFGVVISPRQLSGFTAAVDYYNIDLDSTINALNADDILKQCGLTGNSTLCGLIHRDQFASLWRTPGGYTESTTQNVGKKQVRGVDTNINYVVPVGGASVSFNLIGSYLMKAAIDTGLFSYDCVGLTGAICNDPYSDHPAMQPKWRHLFRASWERGNNTISAGWRMIGSVIAEELSDQKDLANSDPVLAQQLKDNFADKYNAWHYVDLAFSRRLGPGVHATVGVNNVFDKNPPFGSGSNADDYAKGFYGTYDSYGRFVHFSLQFTF